MDTFFKVICNNCSCVHFEAPLEYVLNWRDATLKRELTSSKVNIDSNIKNGSMAYKDKFLKCCNCGGSYKIFNDSYHREILYGSTMSPILIRTGDI